MDSLNLFFFSFCFLFSSSFTPDPGFFLSLNGIQYKMAKTFSKEDVASHSKPDNLWVVIDEDVYDLTQFQEEHPGMSYVCGELPTWPDADGV